MGRHPWTASRSMSRLFGLLLVFGAATAFVITPLIVEVLPHPEFCPGSLFGGCPSDAERGAAPLFHGEFTWLQAVVIILGIHVACALLAAAIWALWIGFGPMRLFRRRTSAAP